MVGVDRNDPDLLTLRAIRALHAADVILFDAGVPAAVLDFARREARKIRVGAASRDSEIERNDDRAEASKVNAWCD